MLPGSSRPLVPQGAARARAPGPRPRPPTSAVSPPASWNSPAAGSLPRFASWASLSVYTSGRRLLYFYPSADSGVREAQIVEEVEAARRRVRAGGVLNTIVMNAVLEACVRCGDVDRALLLFKEMRGPRGCGVDGVSYGILLKVRNRNALYTNS